MATGSEVAIALALVDYLDEIAVDVISVPCLDRWHEKDIIRVSRACCFVIEAGSAFSFGEYAPRNQIFSVDNFGYSANKSEIYKKFELTVEDIGKKIRASVHGKNRAD
jgi:transketolase